MSEEWFVRVRGKEYGPVDLDELREWKKEGRLIRENEIRTGENAQWIRAGEFPEIFADASAAPNAPSGFVGQASVGALLLHSWRIYSKGFWQFLALSALVIVPAVGAQLSGAALGSPSDISLDLRTALTALFNLFILITSLVAWPVYLAGIQILTSELARERSCTMLEVISRALKFWPRVAALCLLVYGAFFLLTVFAFAILLMVATGASSPILILFALGLLVLQVWMFGRVFAATLFWQQTAVLENTGWTEALRLSSALAHRRGDNLPWFRRTLWRGAILASIWCALATALSIGPEWSMITEYFHAVTTMQDPQAILQAMNAHSAKAGLQWLSLILAVLQSALRPLLGIAFVLLYFDSKVDNTEVS